jgi:chaperonin GroEL (HSP60 family)
MDRGIIEPVRVKTQAISSASEVAIMILRIDDVIAAGKPKEKRMNIGQIADYE